MLQSSSLKPYIKQLYTQSCIFFNGKKYHTYPHVQPQVHAHTNIHEKKEYVPVSGYIPDITVDVIKTWNDFTDKLQHRVSGLPILTHNRGPDHQQVLEKI